MRSASDIGRNGSPEAQVAPTITLPVGFVNELATSNCQLDVVTVTTRWLPSFLGVDRASAALPAGPDRLKIIRGTEQASAFHDVPIASSYAGDAFQSGQIVAVEDVSMHDRWDSQFLASAGFKSIVVLPMITEGQRCIGTINLVSKAKEAFTPDLVAGLKAIVELITSFMEAHRRAETDVLTGCLSRSAVLEHLETAFATGDNLTVLYVDTDGFKAINDLYGHATGDAVLKDISIRATEALAPHATIGRLGGDEFLAVLTTAEDRPSPVALAERVRNSCEMPITVGSTILKLRVSIGVATATEATASAVELLHDADQAMYIAKSAGDRIVVADDKTRQHARTISTIDHDLDIGMSDGCMSYYLQPVRHLKTDEILGAEALLRWHHPVHGQLPTELVIDRIEATGRTTAFTEWSLRTAARQLVEIREAVPWFADKAISVNLSALQLATPQLVEQFLAVIDGHGLRREDLIIEVVESTVIKLGEAAEVALQRLGEAGAVISLDDFGTGHNALVYFSRFPIHAIKFDRSLVREAPHNERARTILGGVAATCDELDIMTLAEGVETDAEANMCIEVGIDHVQGWRSGRPVPLDQFIKLVADEGVPARLLT